jgi:hypothetical protein
MIINQGHSNGCSPNTNFTVVFHLSTFWQKGQLIQEVSLPIYRLSQLLVKSCNYCWSWSPEKEGIVPFSYSSVLSTWCLPPYHSTGLQRILFMTFYIQHPHFWEVNLSSSYIIQFLQFYSSKVNTNKVLWIWNHQHIHNSCYDKVWFALGFKGGSHMQTHQHDSPH